jgi:anti-sigma factor RsiW
MLSLSGHIGAKASALVDGQLPPSEEERAWSHVLACPGCRRVVEHEGWTKRQLGSLGAQTSDDPPPALLGSLYAVDAWATVDSLERRSTRRRTTVALVGGGAVGAAVLGLVTAYGAGVGRGSDVPTRPSPANIRQDTPRAPSTTPSSGETATSHAGSRRSR